MRYASLLTLLTFALLHSACDSDDLIPAFGTIDSQITEEEANSQNFDLLTPGFQMQVAIRDDVDGNTEDILDSLDEMAADFLECQFRMGPEIGADLFTLPSGEVVPPLSALRVFVVPFNFECEAVDTDVCAGIHFKSSDLIVISKESLGRCGEFPLWKHELGHRYGMEANHSNQEDFEPCIDPPDCATNDLLDEGIGG